MKIKETGNACITQNLGELDKLFLPCKAISIAHFECVYVALVIHRSKRMRRIIFSFVASGSTAFFNVIS